MKKVTKNVLFSCSNCGKEQRRYPNTKHCNVPDCEGVLVPFDSEKPTHTGDTDVDFSEPPPIDPRESTDWLLLEVAKLAEEVGYKRLSEVISTLQKLESLKVE